MLRKVSADGKMPAKAILTAQKEKGAQSISVSTVEGWRIGEVQDFIIFTTDGEDVVPGSVSSWTGIPAANGDITELTLTGGMDILYPIGAVVMPTATSSWANELISALLVSHNPDGTLRDEAIPEIPDKSITPDKINFTSIPMFSATTAPGQWPALDSTKDVIVPFDTIEYDTAKMLDTKTYQATIPKKGIYHIHARCGIASAGFNPGTTALIRIFKNDNIFKESQRITGSGNSMTIPIPTLDCDALLEKGDVLDVRARCTDSRNFGGGSSQSEFNIRFVAEV
jgi:hypothetical protein|nr:MAG TPA: Complement C1q-like protein [Caudoviricetes sp.]